MLKSINICTDNPKYYDILSTEFSEIKIIKFLELSWVDYFKSKEYNIFCCPSLMMVDLFNIPIKGLDSEIVETGGKYDFPKYAISTPNFMNKHIELSDDTKFRYVVEIPLKKILEYSTKLDEDLIYGLHTKILFSFLDFNLESCKKLKKIYQEILE